MMAAAADKYDTALLGILQNEGKVAPFLDVMLGFLYRRTDFFRIMKTETDKLGFPPGVASKLLTNIFMKYEGLAARDTVRIEEMKKAREATSSKKREDTLVSNNDCELPSGSKDERGKEIVAPTQAPVSNTVDSSDPIDAPMEVTSRTSGADASDETTNAVTTEASAEKPSSNETKGKDEEEDDPEKARQRRELQANPLTYNGAETETYYWSQNITETEVRVKVPSHIVKGRQVKVDIQAKHVRVTHQDKAGQWSVLVDDDLSWEVNKEECMWTLSPGEFVHITLEKRMERWWENVFVHEAKINTRKIDCSRPMMELDDEAQAKIEEMMYNQRQKQMGLPQSHEQKTHEMLRKAWDAEGSPFKGQAFDPSKFSVDQNGVVNFDK